MSARDVEQMSSSDKQPCIQNRIRNWFSSLRAEDKFFLNLMGVIIFVYFIIMKFLGSIFSSFLSEFVAGVLGILLGFSLDRYVELGKRNKVSKQIINSLLVELYFNLEKIQFVRTRKGIDFFDLFQTSVWDMFNTRLVFDNMEILFDLGSLYHRFEIFNSGMKVESLGGELTNYVMNNPKFFKIIEDEINGLIVRLENI